MNSSKTAPKVEPARHWINGEWMISSTVTKSVSPSTGEVLGQYSAGGRVEASTAIAAARKAFDVGGWSHDPQLRSRALLELADRLDERADAIALTISREMGKTLGDATLEATWSPSTLRYNAGTALSQTGASTEIAPGVFATAMREPIGLAGIIVPWNSPLATARTAVITGAGSGLGRDIARGLATKGYSLWHRDVPGRGQSSTRSPIMNNDNVVAIRNAYAVAERKDLEGWINLFTPDGVFVDNSVGVTCRGRSLADPVRNYGTAFSNMHRQLHQFYVDGNVVVVQLALQGTHDGPLQLPFGELSPTGKQMDAPCCDVFELEDGKIKRFDCYPEGSIIFAQLGVLNNLDAALSH